MVLVMMDCVLDVEDGVEVKMRGLLRLGVTAPKPFVSRAEEEEGNLLILIIIIMPR